MVLCPSACRDRTRVLRRFLTTKRSAVSGTDCTNLPLWRPRHDCTVVWELPRSQTVGRARQTSATIGKRCSCSATLWSTLVSFQSESLVVYQFERMSEEASPLIFLLTLAPGTLFIARMKNFRLRGANTDIPTKRLFGIGLSGAFYSRCKDLNYEVSPIYRETLLSTLYCRFFCI